MSSVCYCRSECVVVCVEGFRGTKLISLGKIFFADRVLEGLV